MADLQTPVPSLRDSEIVNLKRRRRVFLATLGLGAAGLLGAVTLNACSRSDQCDADTQTDIDPRDPRNRPKDRCDTDT